jgi:hypothetical protein
MDIVFAGETGLEQTPWALARRGLVGDFSAAFRTAME